MSDNPTRVFKVTHAKGGVETVFLVSAYSARDARTKVLDTLYDRTFFRREDPARLKNDPFGLLAAGQNGTWSNTKLCADHGCSMSAVEWDCDEPYRLYQFDTKTGAMS